MRRFWVDEFGGPIMGVPAGRNMLLGSAKRNVLYAACLEHIAQGSDQLISDIKQMTIPEIAAHIAGIIVETQLWMVS